MLTRILFFFLVFSPAALEGSTAPCRMSSENLSLIRDALGSWESLSREVLRLEDTSLPWMVLFDTRCTWHLAPGTPRPEKARGVKTPLVFAGEPVVVLAEPHGGEVALPDGSSRPAGEGTAFASLADDGKTPFFVLALLDVWSAQPKPVSDAEFARILRGVVSHEIVHTLQIRDVGRRVRELKTRYELPDRVHDDLIEELFRDEPGYREAFQKESDLFYAATQEGDPQRRRALIVQALDLVKKRHARYFTGSREAYREIDALFLNMEGVAVWAAYSVARRSSDDASDGSVRGFERKHNSWSQDEGFALQLLIDDLIPNWRRRMLGEELASPFDLLEESVVGESSKAASGTEPRKGKG